MEEFAGDVFDMVAAFGVGGDVNVTYNKNFQTRDFQLMTETFALVQDFKLPPIVKKRFALEYALKLAEEATDDEKERIREAVEAMTEFDQPALPESTTVAPDVMQRTQAIFESRFGRGEANGSSSEQ
jgi:hypothetical protein